MASTIRIIGVPVRDNHTVWIVDHIMWWPIEDFIEKTGQGTVEPRFRDSVDSSLYLDTVGIFNKEEFVKLNDGYKAGFLANASKKTFHDEQQKRMGTIDEYLEQ